MNTAVTTIQVLAGIYFLLGALMLNTSNARSAFLFKVIPFTLGCALLFVAAYQNGMVGAPAPQASLEATPGHLEHKLASGRPPRVACVARIRTPDIDAPARCYLAQVEIDAFRRLIGVIGAETLFEASEMPIWKVNGRIV